MNWTDERVTLLKQLWGEGLSASQIATQLGGVSRNAVIGKVHRLKLGGRGKVNPSATSKPKKPLPEPTSESTTSPQVGAEEFVAPLPAETVSHDDASLIANDAGKDEEALKSTMLRQEGTASVLSESVLDKRLEPTAPVDTPLSPDIEPVSRRLNLLQLTEHTCKWPVGDPLSPDFAFCGAQSDESSPYCPYHAKVAFQPVSERRRIRA
ncbi:GcrA family cell cycle regulator [Bartonella sp. DGB2]|uniref:GcrA family cell cycle regulator n=1 Tax=Bartonella sp. DGB2 TaxID=3388426 RepID=UPI00398FA620